MASYAILGATGRVGGQILQHLLQQNDNNQLHLYVRSKKKILSSQPDLETNPRVSIYEGDISDVNVIKDCIAGTHACFLAVALSENLPGCSIAMDTTQVVVKALRALRDESTDQPIPKLIVLSSSSVTDKYWVDVPRIVHRLIYDANRNIYQDLERAEKYLRQQADWISFTFIKPGGLSDDIPRGYKLDPDTCHTPMSFADLADAMIEVAGSSADDDRWRGQDVSIVPASDVRGGARLEWAMPYVLFKGLVACYLPWMYSYLRGWIP